jgi:hypothetical protein
VKLTTHLQLVPRLKNEWRCASTPPYAFMMWCSVKHRDDILFYTFLQYSLGGGSAHCMILNYTRRLNMEKRGHTRLEWGFKHMTPVFERSEDHERLRSRDHWNPFSRLSHILPSPPPFFRGLQIFFLDSSVGIALGYELDDRGFESRQELGISSPPRRLDRLWCPPSLFPWE